jgi:predicted O-linked N-acetylglucosamine transferase (SPINDLY family)
MKKKSGSYSQPNTASLVVPAIGQRAIVQENWAALRQICLDRLRRQPRDLFSHRQLGLALYMLGSQSEAVYAFERGLTCHPNDPALLFSLGTLMKELHNLPSAYALLRDAAMHWPEFADVWINLTDVCYLMGKHLEGVEFGRRALTLPMANSTKGLLLLNLIANLRDLGRLDESMVACQAAISLSPTSPTAYSSLLLLSQSMPEVSARDIRETAHIFQQQFEAPHIVNWPRHEQRNADPLRRLRIGFLSPDLSLHAVMYFVEGIFAQLDRRQFEVFALHLKKFNDPVTQRVMRHMDHFHDLSDLDGVQLGARIQEMEIDILIDLAGHTSGNGLGAMARKPAPVQVTWLGYPGTTGLTAMDWRFTDGIADPPGAEAQYSEKLWRLPEVFCVYRPMCRAPLQRYQPAYQVHPAPALANGYITFGSCNSLAKLTDAVLRTWAAVLRAVPGARLLVEGKGLGQSQAHDEFEARCVAQGLDPGRLSLIERDGSQQYLTYHRIDIALDPFPLTGGTTSEDVLWMGLPLVCMQGDSFRSRMGMTLLHNLGHPEWIAQDEQDYVRLAVELAADVGALNSRRLGQRRRMEASALMDEGRFTRHFGTALRQMWQRWCAAKQFGDDVAAAQAALQTWAQHSWPAQPPQVTVAPGQVLSLPEAHAHMQTLTEAALAVVPRAVLLQDQRTSADLTHPAWLKVHEWASFLLDAIPNEPLALATMAEIEHAHGHTEFATTYLQCAQWAMAQQPG